MGDSQGVLLVLGIGHGMYHWPLLNKSFFISLTLDIRQSLSNSVIARYQLLAQIGTGGSGTVWRCRKIDTSEPDLALKVLHRKVLGAASLTRFNREHETQAKLTHVPGVVTLLEHGILDDGTAWLLTDLYDTDYAQRLASLGAIPVAEALDAGYQLASTLAFAHGLGIVHGDIKPSNLLLINGGHTALSDFGASVDLERTMTLQSDLSLAYVSPETLRYGASSPKSDLYSLGACLAHLLSGKSPLPESLHGKSAPPLGALLTYLETVDRLPMDLPDCPDALGQIISELMARDPQKRPADAKSVARQLKALQITQSYLLPVKADGAAKIIESATPAHDAAEIRPSTKPTDTQADANRQHNVLQLTGTATPSYNRPMRLFGALSMFVILLAGWHWWPDSHLFSTFDTTTQNPVADTYDATAPLNCRQSNYLCENFEDLLKNWETEENAKSATLTVVEDGWHQQALAFNPSNSHERGSSYVYQVVAKPVAGESLRIALRMKARKRSDDYFWMTTVQLTSSDGHTWSLNLQPIKPGRPGFDMFYYDADGLQHDNISTYVPFTFDTWMCVEMIINPASQSALQLYVDSKFIGQLERPPMAMNSKSYELVLGAADVQTPVSAPTLLYDNVVVDRASTPQC